MAESDITITHLLEVGLLFPNDLLLRKGKKYRSLAFINNDGTIYIPGDGISYKTPSGAGSSLKVPALKKGKIRMGIIWLT